MQIGQINTKHLRGLGDIAVGLAKELFGTLTGSRRMQDEGEAQQERAREELRALREEAEAQRKEAEAEAHERRQRSAQRARESV